MNKAIAGNVLFIVFWLVGVPLIGWAVSAHNFSVDCAATSGHVVNEGFTTWCRH